MGGGGATATKIVFFGKKNKLQNVLKRKISISMTKFPKNILDLFICKSKNDKKRGLLKILAWDLFKVYFEHFIFFSGPVIVFSGLVIATAIS